MTKKNLKSINQKLLLWLLAIFLLSCSSVSTIEGERWLAHFFHIDDTINVRLELPSGKAKTESLIDQYFFTREGTPQMLFTANYDNGKGNDRDFYFTRIFGSIVRLGKNEEFGETISSAEIKSTLYMSRENAEHKFKFKGEYISSDHKWLTIVLATGPRRGVSFAAPIHDRYVLVLSMSVFGQDAHESRLYQQRLETLKEVLNTVRVTVQ